ncbi:putative F420-0 ABC transporter substrate-binding protein [Cellulomonas edaphi]|uniref:F420-0 ABC transporter substrate-binding protein n=1 Tax=Cellulomonas edaphi TaxID=3053468 RepID=A0ABT7SAL7_9CELL|nr:putative F420-0 ABC transporter substrate-binding protein [Cellulomons edaphi]MDM7832667.1 putative F420-0 ABC transporter substrate-binding protein [Cellulomons edaphi]
MSTSARRRARSGAVLVALGLALAACSSAADGADPGAPTSGSPSSDGPATFAPVSLDNCGTDVTVTSPPERVVTIKSSTTEMMLALGLADRLVGTAFADGPVPEQWAAAAADVPVLSPQVPGQEALLALDPDFVYGGWESNFSADGAGERAALGKLGIGTYVSPAACKEPDYMPDPLTFDDVFAEVHEVGSLFGVQDRADAVVGDMRSTLESATPPAAPTTALWYSSGTDAPYVGAGIGSPQMIMDAAGLTNIFADVHDTWTSAGWEKIVAADPSVIVLVDASWNTAADKIALLESNAATRELTAVREKRYLTLPFAATEAGVRNADAVVSLDEQLAALDR